MTHFIFINPTTTNEARHLKGGSKSRECKKVQEKRKVHRPEFETDHAI